MPLREAVLAVPVNAPAASCRRAFRVSVPAECSDALTRTVTPTIADPAGTERPKLRATRYCEDAPALQVASFASVAVMLPGLVQAVAPIPALFSPVPAKTLPVEDIYCVLGQSQKAGRAVVGRHRQRERAGRDRLRTERVDRNRLVALRAVVEKHGIEGGRERDRRIDNRRARRPVGRGARVRRLGAVGD